MLVSESMNIRQLTAEIVAAYTQRNQVSAEQLTRIISDVYAALDRITKPADEVPVRLEPAVPVRRSVERDHVVCLDCGWRGKMLRRHIGAQHGLRVDQYRARWGLSPEHPLTAPGYSEKRSEFAKQVGLGRRNRDHDGAPLVVVEGAGAEGETATENAG